MPTPADRIALLDALYGVCVTLHADCKHLDVTGPRLAVQSATPMLRHNRAELLEHLNRLNRDECHVHLGGPVADLRSE